MPNHGPLTTGKAAEYCHVSQATIVNWIKDGRLKAYTTPGGHRRILQSDLVSFLEAQNMPVEPALRQVSGPRLLLDGDTARISGQADPGVEPE
jgi:two-component system OmpR family response regulator